MFACPHGKLDVMNLAASRVSSLVTRHATAVWANSRHHRAFSSTSPPLVLVLDVDETLWRTRFPGDRPLAKPIEYDFIIDMASMATTTCKAWSQSRIDDMRPNPMPTEIFVKKRPGLDKFFDWIRARREEGVIEGPWIFTQGSKKYISKVLPGVDPTGDVFAKRILTRKACTPMDKPWPWVHKDLYQVPFDRGAEEDARRVVIVENNPMSCLLYPKNSLMVHDWMGDNPSDAELERVSATLDAVLNGSEVIGGDYAGCLTRMTPGHDAFEQALAGLLQSVNRKFPPHISSNDAIRKLYLQAVKAKTALINQQARQSQVA
jgi:hypothetical protein